MSTTPHDLAELRRESRMGGLGTEVTDRAIPRIDVSDFAARKAEITDQLWSAAVDIGFFQLVGHDIDAAAADRAFAAAEAFFALPDPIKARYPLKKGLNSGWESMTQVRPSIGTPDRKESYQLTRPHMAELWPSDEEVAGFRDTMLAFEARCWALAMQVLSCFADRLGLAGDFFTRAHDPGQDTYQSTLRLLHYFPLPAGTDTTGQWRAGAHTDFDCLTLLFQRDGQGGLQVLPGKDADTQAWTPVTPSADTITCNIGDMLMRWSDDALASNFHRVRMPLPGEDQGARHSMAFFAQANRDAVIQGPAGKYPAITAADYLQQRIRANFDARANGRT